LRADWLCFVFVWLGVAAQEPSISVTVRRRQSQISDVSAISERIARIRDLRAVREDIEIVCLRAVGERIAWPRDVSIAICAGTFGAASEGIGLGREGCQRDSGQWNQKFHDSLQMR
jgi:hypothetical protein